MLTSSQKIKLQAIVDGIVDSEFMKEYSKSEYSAEEIKFLIKARLMAKASEQEKFMMFFE